MHGSCPLRIAIPSPTPWSGAFAQVEGPFRYSDPLPKTSSARILFVASRAATLYASESVG
jgi:hypothetical protein